MGFSCDGALSYARRGITKHRFLGAMQNSLNSRDDDDKANAER